MKKPSGVIYGVDDIPPFGVMLGSALQHVGLMSIFLLFPLLVFREVGLGGDQLRDFLSLSMLAMSVAALLSALRLGSVGSGFLCLPVFSAFYLGPSVLAFKAGGLPLVFGMTMFAGAVEAALSQVQRYLRALFPPELAGLLVLLIGINVGSIGIRYVLGVSESRLAGVPDLAVAACTLGIMIALAVWAKGPVRMFSALLGMTAGYALAAIYGVLTPADLQKVLTTPLVSVPSFDHVGWSWDTSLVLPFAIAALGACLKTVGCVTTCQKINDAEWVRPDLFSIERGVLADAAGTAAAGLLGSLGINSSPTSVGVSGATGVTSRRVGFGIAAIFAALAFLPQAANVLATMPRPVIGAALLFAASYVFMNGLQIISSRLLDARRTFVIGLSVMIALAVDLYPAYFTQLPEKLQPVLGSSLVLGIVCAILLNMVFRLGARQTGRLAVDLQQRDPAKIEEFMEALGAAWGARREVIERARFNLIQSVETILDGCNPRGPVEIVASFDEFNVDIRVSYPGTPLVMPHTRPTTDDIIASDAGQQLLAGFLLRRLADRVNASHSAGRSTLHFHFDH